MARAANDDVYAAHAENIGMGWLGLAGSSKL